MKAYEGGSRTSRRDVRVRVQVESRRQGSPTTTADRRHGSQVITRSDGASSGRQELRRPMSSPTSWPGFGSLAAQTSVLMTPDGSTVEAEAAHGT